MVITVIICEEEQYFSYFLAQNFGMTNIHSNYVI